MGPLRVLFLLIGPIVVASSRVRVVQFIPWLKKDIGLQPTLRYAGSSTIRKLPFIFSLPAGFVLKRWRMLRIYYSAWFSQKFDIVFVHRVLLPLWLIHRLKRLEKKIIFDFDDALEIEGFYSEETSRQRYEAIIKASNYVITSTEYNARRIREKTPNVEVIISSVDPEVYRVKTDYRHSRPVIIGWIGSPSTTQYLEEIGASMGHIAGTYPVELKLVGADPRFTIAGVRILRKTWVLEEECDDLATFDIGVMPLPDNQWTRAKGGYKLLQYMAAALPVVASPVGVNAEIVSDGVNGYLAAGQKEWVDKLSRLIEHPELREKMGKEGRKIVELRYSTVSALPKLVEVFQRVAKS